MQWGVGPHRPTFVSDTANKSSLIIGASAPTTHTLTISNLDTTIGVEYALQDGTLTYAGSGTNTIETLDLSAGTTLSNSASSLTITGAVNGNAATLVNASNLTLTATNTINVPTITQNSGTLTIDHHQTIPTLTLAGGAIDGSGDLTVTATFTWTAGMLTGAGTFTLATGATGTFTTTSSKEEARDFINNSVIAWDAGVLDLRTDNPTNETTFTNNGTLQVLGGLILQWGAGPHQPTFRNGSGGHIVKQTTATASINNITFDNQGELNVAAGQIDINANVANITGSRSPAVRGTSMTTQRFGSEASTSYQRRGHHARRRERDVHRHARSRRISRSRGKHRDAEARQRPRLHHAWATSRMSAPWRWTRRRVFTVTGAFTQMTNAHLGIPARRRRCRRRVALTGCLGTVPARRSPRHRDDRRLRSDRPDHRRRREAAADRHVSTPSTSSAAGPAEFAEYDEVDGTVFVVTDNPTAGCDRVFDAGVDASWNNAANWSGNTLPGPADVACLPPGSPTVNYSGGDTTVKSIRAVGAGSGDLVVSGGSLTTTGDSRFDGTLRINGGTFVSGGATQVTKLVVDGGTLDGAGDITVTSPAATGSPSPGPAGRCRETASWCCRPEP